MWIPPADKSALETTLFHFLLTVRDGQPQARTPLVTDQATLHALYRAPHPDLVAALRHCLDAWLVELGPDPARWGAFRPSPALLGMALAANNCLAPGWPPAILAAVAAEPQPAEPTGRSPRQRPSIAFKPVTGATPGEPPAPSATGAAPDPVGDFTAALLATLPPAKDQATAIAYHALLRGLHAPLARLAPQSRPANLCHALLERSPLTALDNLDQHLPAALHAVAATCLSHWPPPTNPAPVWPDPNAWLTVVVNLLTERRLATWVRQRWLTMPETLIACRNQGLLLEALRRHGDQSSDQRRFLLDFYEAYAYFAACPQQDPVRGHTRGWPVLTTIEQLLRLTGEDEVARVANRCGNAAFLKFLPLLKIIIAEQGIPADYAHLRLDLVTALQRLTPYVSETVLPKVDFGQVVFTNEEHQSDQ